MKSLCYLCGITTLATLLITIVLASVLALSFSTSEPPVFIKDNYKKIYHLTANVQDEWEEALLHSPIKKIVSEGYVGLATKYLVVFESDHLAIAKLVEPFSLVSHTWEQITAEDTARYEVKSTSYSRSGRKFQAWTEVAAYLVSRVGFPIAKKPPAVIRAIPSTLLYRCEGCDSWYDYFKSLLPEHTVYISVHAYLNELRIAAPSVEMMEYLTVTPAVNTLQSRVSNYNFPRNFLHFT